MTAGLIFGKGEAVAISFATAIAQTAILSTILWQKLALEKDHSQLLKGIGLLLAITLGIFLGLKVTI